MGYDALGNYTGPDDQTPAATTPAPAQESGGVGRFFRDMFVSIGSAVGIPQARMAQDLDALNSSQTPGRGLLDLLAQQDEFKTGPGRANLAAVRADTQFVSALDRALVSDRTILPSMISGEATPGTTQAQLMEALADPRRRGVMTQVLDRIAQDPNDDINGEDLRDVIRNANNPQALQTTLRGMGINNMMVNAAANPMGALTDFLNNPQEGLRNWLNDPSSPLAHLSGDNKNLIGRIIEMFSGFLKGFAPGGGFLDDFREFGAYYGERLTIEGRNRGYDGGRNPTRGDGNDIQVAPGSRPTSQFQSAAAGDRGTSPAAVEARVEQPNYPGQTMGGGSLPALGR